MKPNRCQGCKRQDCYGCDGDESDAEEVSRGGIPLVQWFGDDPSVSDGTYSEE
jgi:hypothetical protein